MNDILFDLSLRQQNNLGENVKLALKDTTSLTLKERNIKFVLLLKVYISRKTEDILQTKSCFSNITSSLAKCN